MRNHREIGLWHLILTSEGRITLFTNEEKLRQAVLKLGKTAASHLISFCVVDDHIHLVLYCSRQCVGRLSQALQIALSPIGSSKFSPGYIVPVKKRTHLNRLILYTVNQPQRHGLKEHPALYSGSCFLDLAGARFIGVLGCPITSVLPRFNMADLYSELNLRIHTLTPADDGQVKDAGLGAIIRAAGAVFAAAPALTDQSEQTVKAHRVAVRLARSVGFTASQISCHLQRSTRSIFRVNHQQIPEEALTAVRRRLALEKLVVSGNG